MSKSIMQLNEEQKKKLPYARIGFISFLLLGAVVVSAYAMGKKPETSGSVLGQKTEQASSSSLPSTLPDVKKAADTVWGNTVNTAEKTVQQIVKETTTIIVNTASHSAETAKDYVFDNTVGNFLNQIKSLPKEQQEKVKEYICK